MNGTLIAEDNVLLFIVPRKNFNAVVWNSGIEPTVHGTASQVAFAFVNESAGG